MRRFSPGEIIKVRIVVGRDLGEELQKRIEEEAKKQTDRAGEEIQSIKGEKPKEI